jgi:hypothetical protein
MLQRQNLVTIDSILSYALVSKRKFSQPDDPAIAVRRIPNTDVQDDDQEDFDMDFGLGILTFGTLGFVAAFAYLDARATEKRRRSGAPKSTLAADHPSRLRDRARA